MEEINAGVHPNQPDGVRKGGSVTAGLETGWVVVVERKGGNFDDLAGNLSGRESGKRKCGQAWLSVEMARKILARCSVDTCR